MSVIILVRHGQSEANAAKIIADYSYPLTEKGIEQAHHTGNALSDSRLVFAKIISSPYIRALQTAQVIAKVLGYPMENIELLELLRERGLGELERNPKTYDGSWYSTADTEHGIETKSDLFDRTMMCWQYLKNLSSQGNILASGHGISGNYLTQIARGAQTVSDIVDATELANAEYIVLQQ